jgi:hypothetical protein
MDLWGENPQPVWSSRIWDDRVTYHQGTKEGYKWASEAFLNGLKKNYPDLKDKLTRSLIPKNPRWVQVARNINAAIIQHFKKIDDCKTRLRELYKTGRQQTNLFRQADAVKFTVHEKASAVIVDQAAGSVHEDRPPRLPKAEYLAQKQKQQAVAKGTEKTEDSLPAQHKAAGKDQGKYGPRKQYTPEEKLAYKKKLQQADGKRN